MNHWQTMKEVVIHKSSGPFCHLSAMNLSSTSRIHLSSTLSRSTNCTTLPRPLPAATSVTSETFFVTAVIYFILTFTITSLLRAIEKRIDGRPSDQLAAGNQQQVAVLKGGPNHGDCRNSTPSKTFGDRCGPPRH